MKRISLVTLASVLVFGASAAPTSADESTPINVFILAGQSNMAGADSVVAEPAGFQQTPADRATMFTTAPLPDGAKSALYAPWGELQGHQIKGRLVHGPEVGLARTLHEAGWRNVAMIKVFANFGRNVEAWPGAKAAISSRRGRRLSTIGWPNFGSKGMQYAFVVSSGTRYRRRYSRSIRQAVRTESHQPDWCIARALRRRAGTVRFGSQRELADCSAYA